MYQKMKKTEPFVISSYLYFDGDELYENPRIGTDAMLLVVNME